MPATVLDVAVAATDLSITVDDAGDLGEPPYDVGVNREEMHVTDVAGNVLTVQRGNQLATEVLSLVTFDDILTDGWPNPSDGSGAIWRGMLSDADSNQLTAGGKGLLEILTNNVGKATNLETPGQPLDHQLRFDFTLADQVAATIDADVRWQDTDNYYRARLTIDGAGAMSLRMAKVVASLGSNLGAAVVPPGTVALGDVVHLAMQATGASPTSLGAKAWREADGEPAAWTTNTDSEAVLQVPGARTAVRYLAPTAPATMALDNYTVARVPVGVSHAIGDDVVKIDSWPEGVIVTGNGPPSASPKTGSQYLDLAPASPLLYTRVGTTWYSVALT